MQRLGAEKLRELQKKKLKKLLNHAYTNVPYYHELFGSVKIKPSDINSLEDMKKIPLTTKEDVQKNPMKRLVAKGADLKKCIEMKTTGSTGTPLKIYIDRNLDRYRRAASLYILLEMGLKLSDKIVTIRDDNFNVKENWKHKLGILRKKNISIFKPIENIVAELIDT